MALFVVGACAANGRFRLNHDYPSPPSMSRLREPGACPGGEKLAARALPLPHYPRAARRRGRQGWVVAQLDVRADGTTANVVVKKSAPEHIFGRSAVRAVRRWRFAPAGGDGLRHCLVFIDYRLGAVHIGR